MEFGLKLDEATDGINIAEDHFNCKKSLQEQRPRTCFKSLIHFYLKIIWVALSMKLVPCLAAMEDYRHIFEVKSMVPHGSIVLFTEKRLCQSI